MVTKQVREGSKVRGGCSLAKIQMVTKPLGTEGGSLVCCSLAKIQMVTKLSICRKSVIPSCSLAKIQMVTKHPF